MKYRVKALAGKGEKYVGKNMQLTNASQAGKWTEEKAKNVAKAKSKSSDISMCYVVGGDTTLTAVYKDGNCQKPANAFSGCVGNKQKEKKEKKKDKTLAQAVLNEEELATSDDQDQEVLEQTMTTISDFLSLCDRAGDLLRMYSQKQAQEDALQEDLLHIIELTEGVNAAQGYQLYKDLKNCRKRRRVDKDSRKHHQALRRRFRKKHERNRPVHE